MVIGNIKKILTIVGLISLVGCVPIEQNKSSNGVKMDMKPSDDPVISKHLGQTQDALNNQLKSSTAAKKVIGDLEEQQIIGPGARTFYVDDTKKTNIKVDPNVKLISPPINLPQQYYDVPKVDDKENFVTSTKRTHSKLSSVSRVVIKKGDTLYSISKKYNVPLSELIRINHLKSASDIKIGQTVVLSNDEPKQSATKKQSTKKANIKKKH